MKDYNGFIPPCGIYCGECPNFLRTNNPCEGAEKHCKVRKCKGIYVCCIEKKRYNYCFQCSIFPCSRFKKFAEKWMKLGQNLISNQQNLKELGETRWLEKWKHKINMN
ncbi:DUF3795 domain-containing protein [Alkaliphilus peptidifermentans]|uniref:DUF3795 domain-containing protein n=1 Tax=Alkaliphilus peptidifermentans DSM 18978 TaxID=1120976 RepID=A0A1G5CU60_9FIRM|nr:DUF3795 domain-containing protein [Alkaliphilus peptidifermentans]SCY06023.1 hypothetical protein SAMN03080606_00770 [Alkaliphilus peptidifermentans DSM 18978]